MKESRTVARPTAVESPRHLPLVDLLVDARDGIYLTDPGLRSARPERAFVYYLPPGQTHPIVIDDQMPSPNQKMKSGARTTRGRAFAVCR